MTREEKIMSMTTKALTEMCKDLGIKIPMDQRKHDDLVALILAQEAISTESTEAAKAISTESTEAAKAISTESTEAEKPAPKKERKPRAPKHTLESLYADIPEDIKTAEGVELIPNSKGTAVHVKCGKTRIFGYSGPIVVVTREAYCADLIYEKKNYGFRVDPTAENMSAIFQNYLSSKTAKTAEDTEEAEN